VSVSRPSLRRIAGHPVHWLAFGLGAGLVPWMPGTVGTAVGVLLFFGLAPLGVAGYAGAVALMALFGVWVCGASARELGVHDHPGIVWDEVVGYLVTMLPVAGMAFPRPLWVWILAGFLLFRLFDIAKPGPIRWLDRHVGGGLGIMLDDAFAGVAAGACLLLLAWLAARWGMRLP